MLQFLEHILTISAQRDRTEISRALLDALEDACAPHALTIYRVYTGYNRATVYACAGMGPKGRFVHNAYLPEPEFCQPMGQDAMLQRAHHLGKMVTQALGDGNTRLVLPIAPLGPLLYLIDITLGEAQTPEERTMLMGLVDYVSHHFAVLDYGENDNLTGLPNRKTFDKHLFEILGPPAIDIDVGAEQAERRRSGLGSKHWLAVCDIDHFKRVNDEFGHLIGDEVLVMFARLMRDGFRFQDQLFRFGGEEFVAVLQPTSAEHVHKVFDRFRKSVAEHNFSRVGTVTVSIGYSQVLAADTPAELIERADEALYYVKQHGRNAVASFEELVAQGKLEAKASRSGEIELF